MQKRNSETHDLGFKLFHSFGRAYALATPGSSAAGYYRRVLLTAAGLLARRFDSRVGIVSCCGWNPDWRLPLVADTMMNLELLLWGAAQPGGTTSWRTMALSHARVTLRDLVREDGSTYHVADYLPDTSALRWRGTYQGWADDSTWARGHAWVVYGFTMVYRYTGEADMLDWLASTAYLAEGSTYPSVLLHGVGHLPANKEVGVGLIYGDQYFLEAVLRSGCCPPPARRRQPPRPDGARARMRRVRGGVRCASRQRHAHPRRSPP